MFIRRTGAVLAASVVTAAALATSASAAVTSFTAATHPPSPFASCSNGSPPDGTKFVNSEPEPYVDVDPTSKADAGGPDFIGVQQQDRISNGGSNGLGTSTSGDGGTSWNQLLVPALPRFDLCAGAAPPDNYERASDPWVSYGPDGDAFQISLSFNDAQNLANAVLVSRSTTDGNSWGPVTALKRDTDPNVFNDKESITADYLRAQNAYAVWDRLIFPKERSGGQSYENANAFRGPIWFSKTTNDGASWQTRQIFDPGQNDQTIGNQIVVTPNGDLVDGFTLFGNDNKGGRKGGQVAVIRSPNPSAGDSWTAPIIVDRLGAVGVTVPDGADADSAPDPVRTGDVIPEIASDKRAGTNNVYMVWQDARFTGFQRDQIAFSRSSDGGQTWSKAVRINRDPATQNFNPMIRVDDQGNLGVLYDSVAPNSSTTSVHFLNSGDRGDHWTDEQVGSSFDIRSAPDAGGYFLGDYHGLAPYGNRWLGYSTIATGGTDARTVPENTRNDENRTDVFAAKIDPPFSGPAYSPGTENQNAPAKSFPGRNGQPSIR